VNIKISKNVVAAIMGVALIGGSILLAGYANNDHEFRSILVGILSAVMLIGGIISTAVGICELFDEWEDGE
jgi:hypothetical protein